MFFAMGLVLLIFILPALAISWVIPAEQLSLTAGVMQAFDAFFAYFNLQKLVPIVAIALVCASAGGMLTWLAGPVEGPAADRAARRATCRRSSSSRTRTRSRSTSSWSRARSRR